MSDKDINNLKEMLVDFNEYSTDYTKTRCRELEETIEKTLKEIERLNKQLQLISDEFLKYDWENSSKEQMINQLKSLYNSIFKGSDKE